MTSGDRADWPVTASYNVAGQNKGKEGKLQSHQVQLFPNPDEERGSLMRQKAQLLIVLSLLTLLGDPAKVGRKTGAGDVRVADSTRFTPLHRPGDTSGSSQQAKARILEKYGNIPLTFEQNQGQFDQPVRFLSRGSGYSLFLTGSEAVLSLSSRQQSGVNQRGLPESKKEKTEIAALRIGLAGANPAPTVVGMEELASKSNYFIGNDPQKWRTNVPNYAKVKYKDVYPGIDLVYYGNQGQLEFDFIVAAAVSPSSIGLRFGGTDKMEVDAAGDLIVEVEGEQVRLKKPVAYQETKDGRKEVACAFGPAGNRRVVGFKLGAYDSATPLVIDPVLFYSTYLGGSKVDRGFGIAVDSSGSAYVTGFTNSSNFPTANAVQAVHGGGFFDAFVTKLNPAGSALVYSTYLGGGGSFTDDGSNGIAVDSSGSAYVTGFTNSSNFPTANAVQAGFGGGPFDAFVTKLNPAGSALVYSTYLGGSNRDQGSGIAVDSSGSAYVTGFTASSNFPTASALQAGFGGEVDAFVTKLNPAGSALVYSTYLGGSGIDDGRGIAVDSSGSAYVTGTTISSNFPTANAVQTGPSVSYDAFVTKLNPAGSALVYSTYLGGSQVDQGFGIAVDSSGSAYVTGYTSSSNFPTVNAVQAGLGGVPYDQEDAFVTKLNPAGSALVYSTYLGGSQVDQGFGIALDSSGSAYVTGYTVSSNFPTVNALQTGSGGNENAFVTKLNPAGSALVYSTYLGGSGRDIGRGIAVDSSGSAYVTGFTSSSNFPTANAVQAGSGGDSSDEDAFVTKLNGVVVESGPTVTAIRPTEVVADQTAVITVAGTRLTPPLSARLTTPTGTFGLPSGALLFVSDSEVKINVLMKRQTVMPYSATLTLDGGARGAAAATLKVVAASSQALNRFEFSVVGPQLVKVPFDVQLVARDSTGAVVTSFNGKAYLGSTAGPISLTEVPFVEGRASLKQIKVFQAGKQIRLTATGSGVSGKSNEFDVSGGSVQKQTVEGIVRDPEGEPIKDAVVTMHEGVLTVASVKTGNNGLYTVTNVPCGVYNLFASFNGFGTSEDIVVSCTDPRTFDITITPCSTNLIPVLLVPGMMGSTTSSTGFFSFQDFPTLQKEALSYKDKAWRGHGLLDPGGCVGGSNLISVLKSNGYRLGCNLIAVPYDWRKPVGQVAAEHLKPAIDDAKRTPTDKVIIVSHSMGGLVARAYIQSRDYGKDVKKVAMIGTPNQGAAKAYYLWEGGDPEKADREGEEIGQGSEGRRTYTKALNSLYKAYNPLKKAPNKLETQEFIQSEVKSVRQLLPTFDFLKTWYDDTPLRSIATTATPPNHNSDLFNLNKEFDPQGIQEFKVFKGILQDTIDRIYVGRHNPQTTLYVDGPPRGAPRRPRAGDGTVLEVSTSLPGLTAATPRAGAHFSLVNSFAIDVEKFVMEGQASVAAAETQVRRAITVVQEPRATLDISVSGAGSPRVVDPQGRICGLNPSTQLLDRDIPSSSLRFDVLSRTISISDPAAGQYQISVVGTPGDEFRLVVSYRTVEGEVEHNVHGVLSRSEMPFTLMVSPEGSDPILLARSPEAPKDLRAAPVVQGSTTKTSLAWKAAGSGNIAKYNVYSKKADEAFFELVGSTTDLKYQTDHQWSSTGFDSARMYAVTAVTSAGEESVFSGVVENDDRDQDGVPDYLEELRGTNPSLADTDSDGINDAKEGDEGTDPLKADTDGDGFSDFEEVESEVDPLNPNSTPHHTYFSQFADGGGLSSTVILTNPSALSTIVGRVRLSGSDARPLVVQVDGQNQDGGFPVSVPPRGASFYPTDGSGQLRVGSARVSTDPAGGATILFGGKSGLAGVAATQPVSRFLVPIESEDSSGIATGIAFSNPNSSAVTIDIKLRQSGGNLVANGAISLPLIAGGQIARFPHEIFKDRGIDFSRFRGTLEVSASAPINGMALRVSPGEFATLPVTSLDESKRDLFFAHFGNGQGISSTIQLLNPSPTATAAGTIRLLRTDGLALSVNINGTVRSGSFDFAIPPLGIATFASDGIGSSISVGSVRVSSSIPIGGVILFAGTIGVAGVGAAVPAPKFLVPIDAKASEGISTGVALANSSASPLDVTLRLRDSSGALVTNGTVVVRLDPNGQLARFPHEFFQGKGIDFSEFRGSLEVECSQPIIGMAIRVGPGQLATLPVTPFPSDLMPTETRINGRVIQSSGVGVPGVHVYACAVSAGGAPCGYGTTDTDGRYSILFSQPPGARRIQFGNTSNGCNPFGFIGPGGFTTNPAQAAIIQVVSSGPTNVPTITLPGEPSTLTPLNMCQ